MPDASGRTSYNLPPRTAAVVDALAAVLDVPKVDAIHFGVKLLLSFVNEEHRGAKIMIQEPDGELVRYKILY